MPQLARQLLAVCTTYLYFPWNGIKQLPISYTLISFYMKKKEKKKKKSLTFPRQASISWEGLVGIIDNMESIQCISLHIDMDFCCNKNKRLLPLTVLCNIQYPFGKENDSYSFLNLTSSNNNGTGTVGPDHVRFWNKPLSVLVH